MKGIFAHIIRFKRVAHVVKALVCAWCLWCGVLTIHADNFVVNEKISGKLKTNEVKVGRKWSVAAGGYVYYDYATLPLKDLLGASTRTYCRLVLFDAHTQQPLYELSKNCFSPTGGNNWLYQQTDYGFIEFLRRNASLQTQDIKFNKPEGLEWDDFYVGMYYRNIPSNNFDDEKEIAQWVGINGNISGPYTQYLSLTSDPTLWSGFYIITFKAKQSLSLSKSYLPYEGVTQQKGDFETNSEGLKRQKCNTWEYTYYIPRQAGRTIDLKAPIVEDNNIEYAAYWRWYDNNTFRANKDLTPPSSKKNLLTNDYKDEKGNSIGLTYAASERKDPNYDNMASTTYTMPTDIANWQGADIAADASRYTDFGNVDNQYWREPTLSMRYIFHLRPAKEIADNIKKAIIETGVYENHGAMVFPLKKLSPGNYSTTAYSTLRLDMRDISNYWYYPFQSTDIKNQASESQFSTNYTQCKSISWVVLVSIHGQLYYKYLDPDGSRLQNNPGDTKYATHNLKPNEILGEYSSVSDETQKYNLVQLETGRRYTIMVYATDYTKEQIPADARQRTSPIARFDCFFVWESEPELEGELSAHRQIDKLEEAYTRIGWVTFDDFEGMNFNAPTINYQYGNPYNNQYDKGLDWNNTFYGTVYPQLIESDCVFNSSNRFSPFHGDYILAKTANLAGVSRSGYSWWYVNTANNDESPVLYDRTYTTSGKKRNGYFLYVDAADEPRPIATLDFEARLCTGATLMFTANVANLTEHNAQEYPQLLFKLYGYKTNAEGKIVKKQLIQSFFTGDFKSYNNKELGVWYQVFAKTFVHQGLSVDEFSLFNVTIENACKSTAGADYAIDDIRFYVANDQVEVIQSSDAEDFCEKKEGAYLKLRIDYNMMKSILNVTEGDKPLFYRICNEKGVPYNTTYPSRKTNPTLFPRHDSATDEATNTEYGWVWVAQEDEENKVITEVDPFGYKNLILADVFFTLDPLQKYYVSVALPRVAGYDADGHAIYAPDKWGVPNTPCSIYSKPINIDYTNLKITSTTGGTSLTYTTECGSNEINVDIGVKLRVPDPKFGVHKDIPWKFDFVIGSEKAFKKACDDFHLLDAINHFRTEYPEATTVNSTDTPAKGVFTETDLATLTQLTTTSTDAIPDPEVDDALMVALKNTDRYEALLNMTAKTDVHANFYFIPVPGTYIDPETNQKYTICTSAMSQKVTFTYEAPFLRLGNPKVSYPDDWNNSAHELRLGLAQANQLKQGTHRLRLPINGYRDADFKNGDHNFGGASRNDLIVEQPNANNQPVKGCIRLAATNDPTVNQEWLRVATINGAAWGAKVGTVKNHEGTSKNFHIQPQDHALIVDLSEHKETWTDASGKPYDVDADITFHEGYSYTFSVVYHDAALSIEADGNAICYGTTNFTLNIVPEYVTWTGGTGSNTNWNNDANWRRSSKAELHKDATGQNTEGYQDYGSEIAGLQHTPGNDMSNTPQVFVPMKFTKVTILPNTSTPQLGSYATDQRQGIITTESLLNPMLSEATPNINYCLMLKTEPTTDADGHSYYDCENFYANTCQDVYFASSLSNLADSKAELRNQHYLNYEHAWVDLALPVNKWNMLSPPLHNVYAGDFYLPYNSGLQQSESFKPITFGDGTGDYNRAHYPVYQRSWYDTQARIVTAEGPDDTAQVPYAPEITQVEYVTSEWSHAYNDVEVPYDAGLAYSLLPGGYKTANKEWALFRLPKADTYFDYYNHKGNNQHKQSLSVDRSLNGRLLTNPTLNDNPLTLNGVIEVKPEATQERKGYYLLGNPYMASIDMQLFFKDNPQLYAKYWTLTNGELKAFGDDATHALGRVAPMQAFFVKASTGMLLNSINFRPAQCVMVFNTTKSTALHTATIALHATNSQGHSVAQVLTSPTANNDFDDHEDVEAIFDSKLCSAPQVYTVAGNRAAAINHLTSLRNVPLGVEAENDEEVQFSITGTHLLTTPLYLYDAKTGQRCLLTDSVQVSLQPNCVGRYFITANMKENSPVQTDLRCYSIKPGQIVAATQPDDRITQVQVFDFLGHHLASSTPHQTVYSFTMPRGVYLVTVYSEQVSEGRTFKLIVR